MRQHANDPRWRMREGVAMALQRWGQVDMDGLLAEMAIWSQGTFLEQRAAAAALCEPALLQDRGHVERSLEILDVITTSVAQATARRSEGFQALRKGLAYCWSVAVAALPDVGKPMMERWLRSDDRDVRWIMRQNLAKQRLARVDSEWVAAWQARISLLKAIERSSGAWSDEDHSELKTDEDIDRFVRQLRESWKSDQLAST